MVTPVRRIRIALVGLLGLLLVTIAVLAWVLLSGQGGAAEVPRVVVLALVVAVIGATGFATAGVVVTGSRELYDQATTDPLTGLRFLSFFEERLVAELERCRRYGRQLSVAMIDVDDLRRVNTRRGHLGGSKVIQQVSQALVAASRGDTVLARYGGDEFIVLLPEAGVEEARTWAERIVRIVEKLRVKTARGTIATSVSVGLSTAPACGSESGQIMDAADRALYWAKARGKNRVAHLRDVPPRIALEAGGDYPRLDTPMTPIPALMTFKGDSGKDPS